MTRLGSIILLAVSLAGCVANPRVSLPRNIPSADPRVIVHVLNRTGYGPRPGDVAKVASIGIDRYIDEQLHPELIPDTTIEEQLAALGSLRLSPAAFATTYYLPMVTARQEYTQTTAPPRPAFLGSHLLPIALMTLPGGSKPVTVVRQNRCRSKSCSISE